MFRFAPLAAVFAIALGPACSETSKQAEPSAVAPVTVLDPLPAPEGLSAEIFIPLPEATWKKARVAIGGPALFLPQSLGGVVTTALGMPITVAGEFDAGVPVLGAIAYAPEWPGPRAALGIHVRAGDRLIDQLTKGENARFAARLDPATLITLLEPKGTVKGPLAMGVLGNYLLVSRDVAELTHVGPYVARTMPKVAVPKEDIAVEIPDAALAGPLVRLLENQRKALAAMSEALPILPLDRMVTRLAEVAPDLTRTRVTVNLDDAGVHARLAATPKTGGGPASVMLREKTVGDVSPLRDLPGDALIAILDRESPESRAANAPSYAEALARSAGAEKISKEDRDAIEAALRALAQSRGDWIAAGISFEGTGPLGFVRGAVADKEALEKAMKGLVALAKLPSIKEALKNAGLKATARKAVIEGLEGDPQRVTIERLDAEKEAGKGADKTKEKGAKADGGAAGKDAAGKSAGAGDSATPAVPTSIDLFYLVRGDVFFASAGFDAKAGLRRTIEASGATTFGGAPEVRAALDGLGGDVSFAVVAEPLRLIASRAGKPGSGASAPVVIATGASGKGGEAPQIWARLDIATLVLQELVKHRGAL